MTTPDSLPLDHRARLALRKLADAITHPLPASSHPQAAADVLGISPRNLQRMFTGKVPIRATLARTASDEAYQRHLSPAAVALASWAVHCEGQGNGPQVAEGDRTNR